MPDWYLTLHFAIWNSISTKWDDPFRTWDAIVDESWYSEQNPSWFNNN